MSTSVTCTATASQTDTIIRDLRAAGFLANDISVLLTDRSVLLADRKETSDFAHEHHTKAPEGAATGAGTGAALGAAAGWLAGIGALAIPGLGPFIAAGPLMAALGGATVGGAVGGLAGALVGMGIPEIEAKKYEEKLKTGSSLICVHAEDRNEANRAQEICARAGAQDITTAGEVVVPSSIRA